MSGLELRKKPSPPEESATPPALGPSSGRAEKMVIKHGNLFWVADPRGQVAPAGARDLGLFYNDTRYLSFYQVTLPDFDLELLSSATSMDGMMQADMTAAPRVREEM